MNFFENLKENLNKIEMEEKERFTQMKIQEMFRFGKMILEEIKSFEKLKMMEMEDLKRRQSNQIEIYLAQKQNFFCRDKEGKIKFIKSELDRMTNSKKKK